MERLNPYIELLTTFLEQETLDSSTFEKLYLELFKGDATMFPDEEFLVLDKLFADVDAFQADPDLRDQYDLDEQGLRASATEALRKLRNLAAGGSR